MRRYSYEDVRAWFDALPRSLSERYARRDKHFIQRMGNVHDLAGDLSRGARMLDAGCGTGEIAASLTERFGLKTLALDMSGNMIAFCRERYAGRDIGFETGDIMDIKAGDGEFDLVLSLSVIEWIPEPARAVREVHRVLRPSGRWIVSIPNWSSPLRTMELLASIIGLSEAVSHVQNRMSVAEFRRVSEGWGFEVERMIYHVMPMYSGNLPGVLGPLMGMMCMMSLRKRTL